VLFLFFLPVYGQYKVVGYYAQWIKEKLPANKVQFENLTHINHAFAFLDDDGRFDYAEDLLYPSLNTLAHANNVKIIISIGGWGNSENFALMALDTIKRKQFIDDLSAFIEMNNYDGADFDWEFPATAFERTVLTDLIKETKEKFNSVNPEWLITMAVPTSHWYGQWQNYDGFISCVDWFNAMCYDFHGSWSSHCGHNAPLYQPIGESDGSIETGLFYLHSTRKIPKDKLTVGLPFYGKQFISSELYSSFTGSVTDLLYNEISPLTKDGWKCNWDNVSKVPYIQNDNNAKLITFDDTVSIKMKCDWIKNQGYSGAMIWALGQDAINESQPLLETIGKNLIFELISGNTNVSNRIKDFNVSQNFPNPFNNITTINYQLSAARFVSLRIFDIKGDEIKTIINKYQTAGQYSVDVDAGDLPSGIYLYTLQSEDFSSTKKMILLK